MPKEWWRDRRFLAVLGVLAAVLTVAGVVLPLSGRRGEKRDEAREGAAAPRRPGATASAGPASPSSAATSQARPRPGRRPRSGPATGARDGDGAAVRPSPKRAALVAFRREGRVWVAAEDGSSAKAVFSSGEGAYALSPDGKTLAVCSTGTLVLVDIAVSEAVTVGPAAGLAPLSWAPDSSWLVFTVRSGSGGEIAYVRRDGSGRRVLVRGASEPAVSPEGERLAYVRPGRSIEEPQLFLTPLERSNEDREPLSGTSGVTAFGWVASDQGGVVFGLGRGPDGQASLWRLAEDGSRPVCLGRSSADPAVVFGDLHSSPDGRLLLHAERGDDGYSRTYVVGVDGSGRRPVPSRRDTYPYGWSADGSRVLYFEGNPFQAESTRFMSVRPDGTGRVVVAEGASR